MLEGRLVYHEEVATHWPYKGEKVWMKSNISITSLITRCEEMTEKDLL